MTLRLLADECLGRTLVAALRVQFDDVAWIREIAPGMKDTAVLALATAQGRVLLTEDFGFGDLVFNHGHEALGIVILQLSQFAGSRAEIASQVTGRLGELEANLEGNMTIVGSRKARHRRLPNSD